MKLSTEQIGILLALKRYERPERHEEGYLQDFLEEFHQRQRGNAKQSCRMLLDFLEESHQRQQDANRGGLSLLFSRMKAWFGELGGVTWAYGAGLAYAAAMAAFFLVPRGVGVEKPALVPVKHEVVTGLAPSVEQLEQLDLNSSSQGTSGEQVF